MRYQEVIQSYLAAKSASSREWKISDTLVMCVELDIAGDMVGAMALADGSSSRRPGPIRVTLFRISTIGTVHALAHDHPSNACEDWLVVERYRGVVRAWVAGLEDSLPPSTSTEISSRMQRRPQTPA